MQRLHAQTGHIHTHWHYFYHRKRKLKAVSRREIAIGQIIALSGSLAAGLLLEVNKESVSLFAGAFLLLPGLINLATALTGTLCAKINHQLETDHRVVRVVSQSLVFALVLSATSGLVVGVVGGLIGEFFFDTTFWQVCLLAILSMVGVGLVAFPLMSLLTLAVRQTGADPDNIVGPVETGFTDILSVIAITVIVRLLI